MQFLLALQDVAPVAAPGHYTAAEILMFFGAAGVLLTGLGSAVVNIVVAIKTGNKVDDAAKQTAVLGAKVDQVHVMTNSNLSAVKAELTTAAKQIEALREVVADLKSERSKAEVSKALATPVPAVVPRGARASDPPVAPVVAVLGAPVVEVLTKIENNTAEAVEVLKDQKGEP